MVEGLYYQISLSKNYYLVQLGGYTASITNTGSHSATFLDAKSLKTIGWVRLSPKQMVLWDD